MRVARFQAAARLSTVFFFSILFLAMSHQSFSQQNAKAVGWSGLQFLMGEWSGRGGGQDPGQGSGTFSFAMDLQNTVIVRKNHSEYPATTSRPAYSHDDLMVIYRLPDTSVHAIYFDNEGHIINYDVRAAGDSAVFLSEPSASTPRFRLSYSKTEDQGLRLTFDIAPADAQGSFKRYIEAYAERRR